MTDLAPGSADPPTPSPRRHFSLVVSVACALMAAIYIGLSLGPLIGGVSSPLDQLERPEESLDRLVTRELDLREAMRHGRGWEWRLYRALSGAEDPVREASGWYDELIGTVDSPVAELHRAVLLAESGDVEGAGEGVARWNSDGEADAGPAAWVAAAYLEPPPEPRAAHELIAEIRDRVDPDWFADTLRVRIASRIGDAAARDQAHAAMVARGRALQTRLRILMALVLVLLVAGLVACARIGRRGLAHVAEAPLPPRWPPRDGVALFARALGAPQAILLATFYLVPRQASYPTALAMAADLPVLWWVARYCRAYGTTAVSTFGARPRPRAWGRLVGVALALVAAGLAADAAIDALSQLVGMPSHWADGFAEDILWDPRGAFVLDALNVTVWAPMVEELVFRGLLYGTLRTRLSVLPAALLSAAVFALPHGYAAAGSLSVLASGVLWALAYERTRSLLPGILAHSANNVMSTLWVVTLLR